MPKSRWGRENPDAIDTPDENEYIAPHDVETVQARGFWGVAATDEDKHQYTLEGVTSRVNSRLTGPGVESEGLPAAPESSGEQPAQSEQRAGRRGARHESQES